MSQLPTSAEIHARRVAEGIETSHGNNPNGAVMTQSPWQPARPLKVYEKHLIDARRKAEEQERWLASEEYAQQQAREAAELRLRRSSAYSEEIELLRQLNIQIQELGERLEVDENRLKILKDQASVQSDDIFEIFSASQHLVTLKEAGPKIAEARARRLERIAEWQRQAEFVTNAIASDILTRFETVKDDKLATLREEIAVRAAGVNVYLTDGAVAEQALKALDIEPINIPEGIGVEEWSAVVSQIELLEADGRADSKHQKKKGNTKECQLTKR